MKTDNERIRIAVTLHHPTTRQPLHGGAEAGRLRYPCGHILWIIFAIILSQRCCCCSILICSLCLGLHCLFFCCQALSLLGENGPAVDLARLILLKYITVDSCLTKHVGNFTSVIFHYISPKSGNQWLNVPAD